MWLRGEAAACKAANSGSSPLLGSNRDIIDMRINFFGGPGCGKSTTASWLFSELKLRTISVEYVSEYVKFWAYQKRKIHKYDQVYLFGKQMQDEYKFMVHGVKNIVTDSPVLLAAAYAEVNGAIEIARSMEEIIKVYDAEYPSLNILLNRGQKQYLGERYQTEDQARAADQLISSYLKRHYEGRVFESDYKDRDRILQYVLENIA